mmetsp:Transcript_36518/g.82704  ORF Transcript_36518/g.82704 Transcript_36518/m.82704 type:complete len:200 (-) Transcript_36518:283-882(-)
MHGCAKVSCEGELQYAHTRHGMHSRWPNERTSVWSERSRRTRMQITHPACLLRRIRRLGRQRSMRRAGGSRGRVRKGPLCSRASETTPRPPNTPSAASAGNCWAVAMRTARPQPDGAEQTRGSSGRHADDLVAGSLSEACSAALEKLLVLGAPLLHHGGHARRERRFDPITLVGRCHRAEDLGEVRTVRPHNGGRVGIE